MKTESVHSAGADACGKTLYRSINPSVTLKCFGVAAFRSQSARDYACLIDFDPAVLWWRCRTDPLVRSDVTVEFTSHHVDFVVETMAERQLVEVVDGDGTCVPWIEEAAARRGFRYKRVLSSEFAGSVRLRNVRDLLRYAGWSVPLGDRIRVLTALDEMSSLTLAECLSVVRDGRPLQTVVGMIVDGTITIDIDDAPLSPDAIVRRATR